MKRTFVTLLCLASLCGAKADVTTLTDTDLDKAYTTRNPARTSVHDPSVVLDSVSSASRDYYLVIGSHLGYSRSTNLYSWTSNIGGGESPQCTLFGDVNGNVIGFADAYSKHAVTKVKDYQGAEVDFGNFDAHGWQFKGFGVAGNQWAADMVWNPTMKKWLMYMSLNGDHWGSSIVCFSSDKYTGPFIYQGPVVFSGFQGAFEHNSFAAKDDWKHTDLSIATGATSLPSRYNKGDKWGTYWPNCIDPCVFYDENGKLWMTYGSWSGGIWMLELDENTGLRDYTVQYPIEYTQGTDAAEQISDPYFGRKIAGGYYVSGEGSYVQYIGGYYHLFISYGFFAPDGGYQMRVFRSMNPDGPYVDCEGVNAVQSGGYQMNYGPNAATTRGSMLMGGYQWDLMPTAEIAQGHNSAMTDRSGRSFLVYHTKFNDGTAGHSIRVHQLFQNEEGWLVTMPFEYRGETTTQEEISTTETIANEEIPGDYQLIVHKLKQAYEKLNYVKPTTIKLEASATDPTQGKVSGFSTSATDSWKRIPGTDYVEIKLLGVTYKGVLARQSVDYSNISTLCFTAVSSSSGNTGTTKQRHIWGSKADAKAAIKYTLDKTTIPVKEGQKIAKDVTLPTTSYLGATLAWKSSDTAVLTDKGAVKGDGYVALTMTVSKDNFEYSKTFNLVIGAPSGIAQTEVHAEETESSQPVYDLYGRRVKVLEHGKTYIRSGRKFVY